MKKTLLVASGFLAVSLACSGRQEYPQVRPVDNSGSDSSFATFRMELLAALNSRDTGFIHNRLAENVQVGFDADGMGQDAFKSHWHSNDTESSFWGTLKDVIECGCVAELNKSETTFTCPYTYALWPDTIEPASHAVLKDKDVPLYSQPSIDADVVRMVDYAVVRVVSWKPSSWVKVEDPLSKDGLYVQRARTAAMMDARVIFQKMNGKWKIKALVEGE